MALQLLDQSSSERFSDLLGHKWDKQEDKFTFKKENVVGLLEGFSNRNCLTFLTQLWDPIGLVSPITIKFRIDLQVWSSGYSWDDILPKSIQQTWLENVHSINDLLSFQFDCKLKSSHTVGMPQINGFSDGGEQAYGAVIFLKSPGLGKILLGRFINHFVVDQNATMGIQALCICQSS